MTSIVGALTVTEQRKSSLITQRAKEIQKRSIKDGDKLLIDFFAGAGGATQGFVLAGLKPVFIVEAEPTKVQQYRTNFGNVEVFRRPDEFWPQLEPAYIYAETAILDSTIILNYLDENFNETKFPNITFHVHASPSCRAISSGGRTKKTYGNKDLGNSESTFKWTATVLGLMKEELKDRMTWSLEDSSRLLQKKYDPWRALLPPHTPDNQNTWDFTELGLPQDRVRYVALDKDLSGLVADGGKLANVVMDPADTYVKKLINAQQSPEVQNNEKEYARNKSMQGKISMQKAFTLAGKQIPTGVTHMMGQSSSAQVPSLIRKQNRARTRVAPKKNNPHVDRDAHAEIYVKLTKLAYNDLREFIQTLELTNKVFNIEGVQAEVQAYVANAKRFLQDLVEDDIDSYIDACVAVMNGPIQYAEVKSFAAHTNIKINYLLRATAIFGFNTRRILTPRMTAKLRLYRERTVGDLRDAFGLRIARYYSKDVTDGRNVDSNKAMPTETRPIWAPAMTIQAQGDKDWYIPLFEGSRWHFTGTTVAKMTPMHLKILGGFPLEYNFGVGVNDDRYNENARKAVGDSVPPLVTFRLGMAMTSQEVSNEVGLYAMYTYHSDDLMEELLTEFKTYLKTTGLENPNIVYDTIEKYFQTNGNEFLGEDMIYFKVEMLKPRSLDTTGGKSSQAYLHWLGFLNQMYRNNFFTEKRLKDYILEKGLWRKDYNWVRKNKRFSTDRVQQEIHLVKSKLEQQIQKMTMQLKAIGQKEFKPRDKTVNRILNGVITRQKILQNVYGYILEIRRENSGSSSRSVSTSRSPSIENVLDNNNNNVGSDGAKKGGKRAQTNLKQSPSKRRETGKLTKAPEEVIDLVSSDDDDDVEMDTGTETNPIVIALQKLKF